MEYKQVFDVVSTYLVENFEIPPEDIQSKSNLFKDLHLDSIDALDMIVMLESEFDMEVIEEKLKKIRTVHDIVTYIMKHVPDHSKIA